MSVSPMQQAFLLMEAQRPGWFRETVSLADAGGGGRVVLPFVVFCGGARSGVPQDVDYSFCPRPHGGRQGAGLSGAGAF